MQIRYPWEPNNAKICTKVQKLSKMSVSPDHLAFSILPEVLFTES